MGNVVVPYSALAVLFQVGAARAGSLVLIGREGRGEIGPVAVRWQLFSGVLDVLALIGGAAYLLLALLLTGGYSDIVLLCFILSPLVSLLFYYSWFALHFAREPVPGG